MTRNEHEEPTTQKDGSRIPEFKTIEEEAEFWDTHSTTEFEDEFEEVRDVQFVVSRGRPKKGITVRVDEETLSALTDQAHLQGIGPSTLVRMWILQRLREKNLRHASR
ncbi:MAG: CopG family antitoxin [Dehalococcoidia bacterium]|nr:CopG family antitoxin [Dehalococcoidia bacterium]